MNRFQKIIIAIATLCLAYLLWRLNPAEIWGYLTQVGFALTYILAQEIVPHLFNAVGWRFAFVPEARSAYPFWSLVRLRIAGDGVNYLTPSATIAGEFYRASALDGRQSQEIRYGSIAVAKTSQAIAQLLFILAGLAFIVATNNPVMRRYGTILLWIGGLMAGALGLFAVACVLAWRYLVSIDNDASRSPALKRLNSWLSGLGDVPAQTLGFLAKYPVAFAVSCCFFVLGYAWSAIEGLMICYALGLPITFTSALVIEILSNVVDSIMFMVPAKIGTQEAGKTAIFIGLGLPASAGFAFGVVRHIREVIWGGIGLFLCYSKSRPSAEKSVSKADIPAC